MHFLFIYGFKKMDAIYKISISYISALIGFPLFFIAIYLFLFLHLTQLFKVNLQMNLDMRLAKISSQ